MVVIMESWPLNFRSSFSPERINKFFERIEFEKIFKEKHIECVLKEKKAFTETFGKLWSNHISLISNTQQPK